MIKVYLYKNINSKIFIILFNGLILFMLYFLLLSAKQQHLVQQELNLSRATAELAQQALEIKKSSSYQLKINQLEQEWRAVQTNALTLSQVNSVFPAIESTAKQAGVSLTHIAVKELITLTLESDYISLLNFLENLKKYPYFLLNDLQLKRDAGFVVTTLKLHILLAEHHE